MKEVKEKRRQFIISLLILIIGITLGLGLGFWLCYDNHVKIYTIYEWTQEEK